MRKVLVGVCPSDRHTPQGVYTARSPVVAPPTGRPGFIRLLHPRDGGVFFYGDGHGRYQRDEAHHFRRDAAPVRARAGVS